MAETIGQRLKNAREYRNLTLEKVAEATRIRLVYLQALEADDFSSIPFPVQARGFLRNYAQYLELDLDQMVEELRASAVEPETETEVVFEGESEVIPQDEVTDSDVDEDTLSEPFWQKWLKRVKQESGKSREELASPTEPEAATVSEPESAPETDPGTTDGTEASKEKGKTESRPNLWNSFLSWANIRISRKQMDTLPSSEEELTPENEVDSRSETLAEPAPSSQEIINNIGMQLRLRREMISLSLEEIERHTHMRAQFLKALENGNFDELLSPVQTRGMLSNYASFLDLDVDELLLQFADALQTQHRERHPEKMAGLRGDKNIPTSVPTLRSFIAGDMVFGVGVVLVIVAFSVWGISRVIALQSDQQTEVQAEATSLSISEALIGTPVEAVEDEVTLIPAEDTPIPDVLEGTVEVPTLALDAGVQINVIAVERTFMRVAVDGEVAFDGRTIPGNAYPFEADQSVEILAGNGAALRVIHNQRDLGLLGGFGQIARYLYTPDEILVPTPEIPSTPTSTPFVTPTPTVTPSPTPTEVPIDDLE